MSVCDYISIAGGWEGYRVAELGPSRDGNQKRIELELGPPFEAIWSQSPVVNTVLRYIKTQRGPGATGQPLDAQTFLVVLLQNCCVRTVGLLLRIFPGGKYARVTTRLAASVAKLCDFVAIKRCIYGFIVEPDEGRLTSARREIELEPSIRLWSRSSDGRIRSVQGTSLHNGNSRAEPEGSTLYR